jgi:hypothetical protein
MENHKENENWFSSLIGFFYERDIVMNLDNKNYIIDKNKIINLYLSSINNNKGVNKKSTSIYQLLYIIISKYLLSFYYYKDIIFDKYCFVTKEFRNLENVHIMSH